MSHIEEGQMIAEAVRQTYREAGVPWPPSAGGPVPLDALVGACRVVHEEVAGLNHAAVSVLLGRWGIHWADIPQPDPVLAGFLYANARRGYLFVRRGDGLPRRRFTAAHELGHYRLHLAPALARSDRPGAEMVQSDETVSESGGVELAVMELQANRFAAELIMPEAVCRTLFDRYSRKYGRVPRFLIHHLASELLVSREAIHWRLRELELIGEQTWLTEDRAGDGTGKKDRETD